MLRNIFILKFLGKLNLKPNLSMFCVLSENDQLFKKKKKTYFSMHNQIVWETQKKSKFGWPSGFWGIARKHKTLVDQEPLFLLKLNVIFEFLKQFASGGLYYLSKQFW